MSTSPDQSPRARLSAARVLLVGVGGLGCPAALALVRAGVGELALCDEDEVDESNLHRQILFGPADVGRDKAEAASESLAALARVSGTALRSLRRRFLPDTATDLTARVDLVIEGADNFATKFLVADACRLAGVPVVHGAAIRWRGSAWAVSPSGGPCYRCLYEDIPSGPARNCDSEGVAGPVVGVVGALMAELALRLLTGGPCFGEVWTFDGWADSLRRVPVHARATCELCGSAPRIASLEERRYVAGAGCG